MLKIELIHPNHPNSTDSYLDPPLGLLLIATFLKESFGNNIELSIKDLGNENTKIDYADIYGLTVYAPTLDISKKILSECKSINSNCITVVGGAHPSALPEDFIKFSDYIVVGDGEFPMKEIIEQKPANKIIIGKPFPYFLLPMYELIDIFSYHRIIDGKTSLPYITSRGCPYKCNFCGLNKIHEFNFRQVRFSKPETVADDLNLVIDNFGIKSFNFIDDIFTLKKDRLLKILELIKPLNISFRAMGRAGLDNEEVYERLADAGCAQISWGIESGSQYILDRMNKKCLVQDNLNVIQWAKKYGITSRAFFIFGFPGETRETIEETKDFIDKADPDQFFVSNFIPYPGTPVWRDPGKFGITKISSDFSQFYQVGKDGTGGVVIETEWLKKDEFRELELEFREWIRKREMRGMLQDYEEKLYTRSEK